jgi:hypothetical protein
MMMMRAPVMISRQLMDDGACWKLVCLINLHMHECVGQLLFSYSLDEIFHVGIIENLLPLGTEYMFGSLGSMRGSNQTLITKLHVQIARLVDNLDCLK